MFSGNLDHAMDASEIYRRRLSANALTLGGYKEELYVGFKEFRESLTRRGEKKTDVEFIFAGFVEGDAQVFVGREPLVANSPFLSWAYHAFGLMGISRLLGVTEIAMAILISLRPVNARLSAYGSIGTMLMFSITLTLLFTTPGVIAPGYSFPVLSANVGQFLAKDLVFLGAATWTAGEALRAARR